MAGYQTQSEEVLDCLVDQFNQPEHIPVLSELFSKMLVLSAENNFETIKPNIKPLKHIKTYFTPEHKLAYFEHEKVCKEWRKQGRPSDTNHPATTAKLNSQRNLQKIAREAEANKSIEIHNDLLNTFTKNISQVSKKMKKIRGEACKNVDIPFIETLNGVYSGKMY